MGVADCDNMLMLLGNEILLNCIVHVVWMMLYLGVMSGVSTDLSKPERDVIVPMMIAGFRGNQAMGALLLFS